MTNAEIELLINDRALADAARTALEKHDSVDRVTESSIRPVHNGFKPFIAGGSIAIGEIAIVTLLQAVAYDRPVVLLPLTALGRYQHQTLISTGELSVADLPGRTVGVRAWSQTTGVWVRGFLAHQYDVDLRSVRWRTYESGHVPEHPDPEWVARADVGASLADDLLAGWVDFAVMGNDRPADQTVRSVIADPRTVAEEWAHTVGYAPVNHVFAVQESTARQASEAICAMYDAVRQRLSEREGNGAPIPLEPCGFAALRPAISAAAQFAYEQGLLPRPVEYDELVERTCEALGVTPERLGEDAR